ncbi:NAD(P)H-hydrate epimerase [Roseovarius spongiae]|uniref:NAD(P)H-hydrate epimerase n=1 Tax=Roseovarius spongiae TaxID=2320272 RepID=A0A3A8B8Q7_9RHOB|nr:NAD(P)H-hydrate epimerase [Roseovarius spongiae]
MTERLTAARMRAVEQAAINSGDVTGLELMERAGRGVVEAVFDERPKLAATSHRAVVLCGPGNNGGDGFVVARLLKERGWEVDVFLYGAPAKLPPNARTNYERWAALGPTQRYCPDHLLKAGKIAHEAGVDEWVVVDALFGIGQRAPLDDVCAPFNALLDAAFDENTAPTPFMVNIDLPTGYDADTGEALARRPFPADLIVTFHGAKPIHAMPHMADAILRIVDIGL